MKLSPKFTKNIIVGIIYEKSWYWCCTDYTNWILDMRYLNMIDMNVSAERQKIEILDKNSIGNFLCDITEYLVSTNELRNLIFELVEYAEDYWDMLDYLPTLFIDFDKEILISQFHQHNMFEDYLPSDKWIGKHDYIELYVQECEQYWVKDGKRIADYFEGGGNNLKKQT